MKIRLGFVSNSSSCSFCIYGWALDLDDYSKEDLKSIISKLILDYNIEEKNKDDLVKYIDNNDLDTIRDWLKHKFRDNFEEYSPDCYVKSYFYVGRIASGDPDKIKENALKIGKYFNLDVNDICWHEQAWYDG